MPVLRSLLLFVLGTGVCGADTENFTPNVCYPSSTKCPSPAQFDSGAEHDHLLDTLRAAGGHCPWISNTVVLSLAHASLLDIAHAQLLSVQYANASILQCWVVLALDEDSAQTCRTTLQSSFPGISCVLDPVAKVDPIPVTEETRRQEHHMRNGRRAAWRALEIAALANRLGFNVLYNGAAVAWLADPQADLRSRPEADLLVVPCSPNRLYNTNAYNGVDMEGVFSSPGSSVSPFLYMIRSGPGGAALLAAWLHEGASKPARSWSGVHPSTLLLKSVQALPAGTELRVQFLLPSRIPGDSAMTNTATKEPRCERLLWIGLRSGLLEKLKEEMSAALEARKQECSAPMPWVAPVSPVTSPSSAAFTAIDKRPEGGGDARDEAEVEENTGGGSEGNMTTSGMVAVTAGAAGPESGEGSSGACAAECYGRGTCFEELGRCDCPSGLQGSSCQEPMQGFRKGVDHLRSRQQSERSAHWMRKYGTLECARECGAHGVCFLRGKGRDDVVQTCVCTMGKTGGDCTAEEKHIYCLGGCGGRGRCERGFCVCDRGFYGADCGLIMTPDGTSRHVPYNFSDPADARGAEPVEGQRPVRIYVYELPPQLNVWLYAEMDVVASETYKDGRYGSTLHPSVYPGGFYVGPAELFLFERLLASAHRTTDPKEADYFFVPALGQAVRWLHGGPWKGMWGYWTAVRDYLQATWPFWDAKGGADHLWVQMGDHGACEDPRGRGIPTALQPSILLSHWGLYTDSATAGFSGLRSGLVTAACAPGW
ncbi:hypothetical protein CYMTET_18520 [Cymbomonas tetramitiformis]|uniref:EGF-like domain-containing protein n=1 Tax=Cymbomonas tetramitiformis TaxID=36881 RepID=A0AAE0G986_9CHLO|nr:hypothetical protein CYMTET_18520 [Cymbomonas tetramitiformis]